MNRGQEITKALAVFKPLIGCEIEVCVAYAKLPDCRPATPWHSVKDGDLPRGAKDDVIDPPFLVKTAGGDIYTAYYGLREEDKEMCFFDDCGLAIEVDYWMEIPELPTELER